MNWRGELSSDVKTLRSEEMRMFGASVHLEAFIDLRFPQLTSRTVLPPHVSYLLELLELLNIGKSEFNLSC